jgi:hypothetical protein
VNFKDALGTVLQKSGGLEELAKEYLDEYKKTVAILETFGFSAGKFIVSMGLPPEIHTSIKGSIDNIHTDALKQLGEEHKDNKLLVHLLDALILTKKFWEHVDCKLKCVTINFTLGMLPKVSVEIE